MPDGEFLTPENRARLDELALVRARYHLEPHLYKHILFRPCRVRILMVADSFLYFSDEEFGLSDLIGILAAPPGPYVRFELTCAHRSNVSDAQVAIGNPHVARSIKSFRFDNPNHFGPNMYEEVWLFGAETSYLSGGQWQNRPTDAELRALSGFMDDGGGLFATGDHGALGAALGGFVPRARSMRLWFAEPGPNNEPVAPDMNSPSRNDTNRPGHPDAGGNLVFDFDDQSDDIPQPIQPTPYSRTINKFLKVVFPHPLLCGPRGPIRVLPDHPHEGECISAYELDREFDFGAYHVVEYPASNGPQPRPAPEIVATSSVLAGNNVKLVTFAQEFGAIGAYDGEAAGVGRVSVDATWHHFININLTGRNGNDPTDPKTIGFLASPSGRAHYEDIKAYFRNIAVWLAPTASRRCMRRCGIWAVLWDHRLLEAVTPGIPIPLREATVDHFLAVGRHARDALGKFAGRCRSLEWDLDILRPIIPWEIYERLRPWPPWPPPPDPDPVPWLDEEPVLDLALGGGIIALRDAFPDANELDVGEAEERMLDVLEEGAVRSLEVAAESAERALRGVDRLEAALRSAKGQGST